MSRRACILFVIICGFLTEFWVPANADVSLLSTPIDMVNVGNGAKRTINVPSGLQDLSGYHGARITLINTGSTYCRVEGRSWCIDCAQRQYGIVEKDELVMVEMT